MIAGGNECKGEDGGKSWCDFKSLLWYDKVKRVRVLSVGAQ